MRELTVFAKMLRQFLDIFAKDVMISEYLLKINKNCKDSPRVCNTQLALSFMGLLLFL